MTPKDAVSIIDKCRVALQEQLQEITGIEVVVSIKIHNHMNLGGFSDLDLADALGEIGGIHGEGDSCQWVSLNSPLHGGLTVFTELSP